MTIDPIIVTEQESGLTTEGRGLSKLLNDPGHRGMIRRREMNHPPSTVFEDDKHIEKRKVECDHGNQFVGWSDVLGRDMYLRMLSLHGGSQPRRRNVSPIRSALQRGFSRLSRRIRTRISFDTGGRPITPFDFRRQ